MSAIVISPGGVWSCSDGASLFVLGRPGDSIAKRIERCDVQLRIMSGGRRSRATDVLLDARLELMALAAAVKP